MTFYNAICLRPGQLVKHHWYIWDKTPTEKEGFWHGNRIGHNWQQLKMLNFRGWSRPWAMNRFDSSVHVWISSQLHEIQAESFSSDTSMENCSSESNTLQDPLIASVHEKLFCYLELLPKSISIFSPSNLVFSVVFHTPNCSPAAYGWQGCYIPVSCLLQLGVSSAGMVWREMLVLQSTVSTGMLGETG